MAALSFKGPRPFAPRADDGGDYVDLLITRISLALGRHAKVAFSARGDLTLNLAVQYRSCVGGTTSFSPARSEHSFSCVANIRLLLRVSPWPFAIRLSSLSYIQLPLLLPLYCYCSVVVSAAVCRRVRRNASRSRKPPCLIGNDKNSRHLLATRVNSFLECL